MEPRFEWDSAKAAANERKHGVSFAEASTVFGDPLSLTISDPDHSVAETRFLIMGRASSGQFLAVVHTMRGERVCIISARPATRRERRDYEQGQRQEARG